MKALRRFRVLVPTVWGFGCLIGFSHPGDEYLLFGLGSIAGAWAALLADGPPATALPLTLLAGGALTCGLGLLLDALRATVGLWVVLWLAAAAVVFGLALAQYSSVAAAIGKHGSLLAYAAFASQAGVYAATLLTAAAAAVRRWLGLVRADLAGQRE